MSMFGVPGIGGSLGKCAVCGENFLVNILTDEKIPTFRVEGITQMLSAHKKCMVTLAECSGENWHNLPDKSPLKEAFLKANAEAA